MSHKSSFSQRKSQEPDIESELWDVPNILLYLFPDSCLPLPASEILRGLTSGPEPEFSDQQWVACPILTEPKDTALAQFLNHLGDAILGTFENNGISTPSLRMGWVARTASNSQAAEGLEEDEGLAPIGQWVDLVSTDPDRHNHKEKDLIVCGVLSGVNAARGGLDEAIDGASHIFSTQDGRQFVISLIFDACSVRVCVLDRVGVVVAEAFDINTHPESFVRVLAALMFTNDRGVLGFDTSITSEADGRRFVSADGARYELVKPLFLDQTVCGRGTVCWHAKRESDGRDFVIKDTWPLDSLTHAETNLLRKASGIPGIVEVVAECDVAMKGIAQSTARLRDHILEHLKGDSGKRFAVLIDKMETRIHHRVVMTPLGVKLEEFSILRELISVFIDTVQAHSDLVERRILHCDASIGNIVIVRSPSGNPAALGCGFLIDMDNARMMDEGVKRPVKHRTGTQEFMSRSVLMWGDEDCFVHEPRHDLESFFLVFLWICWHYAGPCSIFRQNFDLSEIPALGNWADGEWEDIARCRNAVITKKGLWRTRALDNFAPYFAPLKPLATEWKELVRTLREPGQQVECLLTHAAVLAVLRKALDTLPETETWSMDDDPAGYGLEDPTQETEAVSAESMSLKRVRKADEWDTEFPFSPCKRARKCHASLPTIRRTRCPATK
ncbi:unnamed protein product [Mycena citricolor]|uniref:Fungal-type protein kinase domain-containing protein n=1 Tax=Mycena citricolor TaxID=2018698 RepID=A0AAD2GZ50_9AGAR|nr:unnamed protein product [Mycena citricolor]